MPLVDPSRPSFRQNFARPDSHVALCFTRPVGEISLTGIATAVLAVLVVPFALDQEGPASPEDTAGSDSVVALCLVNPGGRTSPTVLQVLMEALVVSCSRGTRYTSRHCKYGCCRSTMLFDSRRSFTSRLCVCLQRRRACLSLRADETQLDQKTLRVLILSRPCAQRSQGAVLHQQTVRLLRRRHRSCKTSPKMKRCACRQDRRCQESRERQRPESSRHGAGDPLRCLLCKRGQTR